MSHLCLNNLHARKYIDTDFFNQKYHAYNVAKLIKYQHFFSLNCYMIFPINIAGCEIIDYHHQYLYCQSEQRTVAGTLQ